jgi:hypothetical protein
MVIWAIVATIAVTLELIGFVDAKDGWPTASQLIKQYRQRHPWVRGILLTAAFLAGPLIYLHLIADVF